MSKKNYCPECFCEMTEGECSDCGFESPKKKKTISDKRKVDDVEMFRPEDEGRTWFPVKSPYKDYRKKQ